MRAGVLRLLLAFGSGLTVLMLEIAGARLLASTFGLSSIPWTAVIATVLGGLTVGNFLGGLRALQPPPMLTALFLAGGIASLAAIAGASLPAQLMLKAGFLGGAVLSALLFFFLPSVLMGATTPILVARSTRELSEVGLRFGHVGAWSTAGSIVGTLGTGLLLLPSFPLPTVLAITSSIFFLFAIAAAALERSRPLTYTAACAAAVPLLLGALLRPETPGEIFVGQSPYASLRVVDNIWYGDVPVREFWQNGSLSSAEHRETGEPTQFYKITLGWLLTDRLERIDSVLVLGGAANTLPSQLLRMNPALDITVVEIDGDAVDVAREFFSFGELGAEAIQLRVEDARPFLRRDSGRYDVIISDAYDNLYSVPWHLVTREAFAEMVERLAEGGLLTLTLSTPLDGPGAEFLRRVDATLQTVLPYVRTYVSRPDFGMENTQEILLIGARAEEDFPQVEWPWMEVEGEGPILTDDYAPVEFLQAVRFFYDRDMD